MIAHLTSRHPSNDARIYIRSVSTLREMGLRVYYYSKDDGLTIYHPDNILFDFKSGIWGDMRLTWRMLRYACTQKEIQLIHFHDPEFLLFLWLPAIFGKRVVYDIHENFRVKFQFGTWFKRVVGGSLFRFFEIVSFRFIDGIVTVSTSLGDQYKSHSQCQVIVRNVPLKASMNFTYNNADRDLFRIYVSGNHSEQRNCSSIIKALPLVLNDVPSATVLFVGKYTPDSFEDYLRHLASELGVEDHVLLEALKPYDVNLHLASQSGLGLVLYEDNINNQVGMPNRLFEYMASGMPVIVEDFPELRHVVMKYNCGVCVDSSDPMNLAKAIISVLKHPILAREMGERGRKAVLEGENFETECKELLKLYRCLKVLD